MDVLSGDETEDSDDEMTAQEWADAQAEFVGSIWKSRYPDGRDWLCQGVSAVFS